jgi:O-antigen ligase
MLPALVLSYSRGAWLAVVVATGVVLLTVGRRAALLFGGALVLGIAAFLGAAAANLLPERITHTGSGLIRIDLWKSALQMVRDHPVFGIGLDQFLNQHQGPYADAAARLEPWLSHPHNIVLDWWLSLGLLGLLVGGWIAVRALLAAWRLAHGGGARLTAPARAALAGLTVVVAHGMIDNSYFLQDLALTVWFFCALLQILWRPVPESGAGPGAVRPAATARNAAVGPPKSG